MKRSKQPLVAMVATNDLSTDRRVLRHADTLSEAGCDVVLLGREWPWSTAVETPHRVVRWATKHTHGWRFYAEFNRRARHELLSLRPDILWANDIDTLPACSMARRHGARLVFDAHELMAEVPEVQGRPVVQGVWRLWERLLMPRCDARLTVCDSLAEHYRHELGLDMTVVRNLPEGSTPLAPKPSPSHGTSALLLYQGAVNMGRGVDWAIDALEWLPECRLKVVGKGDLLEQMQGYAATKPWADRIEFCGAMSPSELARLTPTADVGLVMLEDLGLSYHYALPNRIGDFLYAGVPIVVSDLPEMASVVHRFRVGVVMDGTGAEALAKAIRRVLQRTWQADEFARAQADMDWNQEKKKLIQIINQVKPNK